MSEFQNIVMIVAVVLLIISLLILAVVMWNNRFAKLYPPVLPGCPDYWAPEPGTESSPSTCHNVYNLGNGSTGCKSFSHSGVNYGNPTSTSNCAALDYARKCNITWDGITNNSSVYSNSNCKGTPISSQECPTTT